MSRLRWAWSTPLQPGAIAAVTVHGEAAHLDAMLACCCARVPSPGRTARCTLADQAGTFDDGLVARICAQTAILMPHGGVRIAQRTTAWLASMGAVESSLPDDVSFPECGSTDDAAAARMASRCASRRALDLLRDHGAKVARSGPVTAHDRARAARLSVLIDAPTVVIAGPANVGKSTLTNTLARHAVSVTDDAAGTTRDPVPVRIELDGVTVEWVDLPGLLERPGARDAAAAAIAASIAASARLIVLATAPGRGWPHLARMGGLPILRVLLQDDRADAGSCDERRDADCCCSAAARSGLDDLAVAVRRALVADGDLDDPRAWAFDALGSGQSPIVE